MYIHTYRHTCIHTHTYIHTYKHTYIHTNIHTYAHVFHKLFVWRALLLVVLFVGFLFLFVWRSVRSLCLSVPLFVCRCVYCPLALPCCCLACLSLSRLLSETCQTGLSYKPKIYIHTKAHTHKHIDSSILSFVHRERPLLPIRSHSLVPWTTSMLTLNLKYIHTNTACHRVAASTSTHWQQQQRRWRWRQRRRQRRHLQAFGFCYFCRFLLLFALVPCVICLRFLSVFWHVFRFAFFRCSFLLLSLSLCCSALCFVL